jgi:type IV secretory pathway VirB10-like protein
MKSLSVPLSPIRLRIPPPFILIAVCLLILGCQSPPQPSAKSPTKIQKIKPQLNVSWKKSSVPPKPVPQDNTPQISPEQQELEDLRRQLNDIQIKKRWDAERAALPGRIAYEKARLKRLIAEANMTPEQHEARRQEQERRAQEIEAQQKLAQKKRERFHASILDGTYHQKDYPEYPVPQFTPCPEWTIVHGPEGVYMTPNKANITEAMQQALEKQDFPATEDGDFKFNPKPYQDGSEQE